MNNEALVALRDPEKVEKSLVRIEAYRLAAMRGNTIKPDYTVRSAEDNDRATEDRATIKAGAKAITAFVKDRLWLDPATREFFAALEEAESRIKGQQKALVAALDGRVEIVDKAKIAWTRDEERRIAAAQEAQRKADADAETARQAALASGAPEEETAPAVQVYVPPAAKPTFSKVGGSRAVVKMGPPKCELWIEPGVEGMARDAALARAKGEVLAKWPHALDLNTRAALVEFQALVARGQVEKPSEAGTVINGIRFFCERSVSG